MRRLMMTAVAVMVLGGAAAAPRAQAPGATANTLRLADGAPRPAARVADLAWLSGRWVGEGLGGQTEETWSAPLAGAMVGHFRLVKNGKLDGRHAFFSGLTFRREGDSLEIFLALRSGETVREEKFVMRLAAFP